MNKTSLIFEGAGWEKAENNGVGNCRIRTRLKNKEGKIIYFECTSLKQKDNSFIGFVSHCFYDTDKKTNHSIELAHIEKLKFNYNKEDIIKFVNLHLNCDFNDIIVDNEKIKVHDYMIQKYICANNEKEE